MTHSEGKLILLRIVIEQENKMITFHSPLYMLIVLQLNGNMSESIRGGESETANVNEEKNKHRSKAERERESTNRYTHLLQ